MTAEEQRAIYAAIHKVQLSVLKDNQEKHEGVLDRIHNLAEAVQEHNGVKDMVKENANAIKVTSGCMKDHMTVHKTLDKQKSGVFFKATTVVAILIAAAAAFISALT